MKNSTLFFYWAARIIAALIMLQTLYFKFTANAESVEIFTKVGMEPWGRLMTGVLELIASALILFNTTAWIGAGLAMGLMGGAILMHVTILGVEVRSDGGYLFSLAIIVFACSAVVLLFNRARIALFFKTLAR